VRKQTVCLTKIISFWYSHRTTARKYNSSSNLQSADSKMLKWQAPFISSPESYGQHSRGEKDRLTCEWRQNDWLVTSVAKFHHQLLHLYDKCITSCIQQEQDNRTTWLLYKSVTAAKFQLLYEQYHYLYHSHLFIVIPLSWTSAFLTVHLTFWPSISVFAYTQHSEYERSVITHSYIKIKQHKMFEYINNQSFYSVEYVPATTS